MNTMKFNARRLLQGAAALVLLGALGGCAASWKQVSDKKPFKGPSRAYIVNLPDQWKRAPTDDTDHLVLTREGLYLQQIRLLKYPLKEAFPVIAQSKAMTAEAWSDLLPEELADWQYKQLKAGVNPAMVVRKDELKGILGAFQPQDGKPADATSVQIRLDPSVIDGRPVFELETRSFNSWGLEYRTLSYGYVHEKHWWLLQYSAPALLYFDRDLPTFQAFKASLKIKESCFLFCSD